GEEPTPNPIEQRVCSCGREFSPAFWNTTRCRACVLGLVDAAPVREHVEALFPEMNQRRMSAESGVPWNTIRSLRAKRGRQLVSAQVAEQLLALEPIAEAS
uniref:hypothetical protein n=1 Tax=Nocardia acidivorans TaxID=404580 RepID=UPI000ACDC191